MQMFGSISTANDLKLNKTIEHEFADEPLLKN